MILCSSLDARIHLFNANFSACKLIIDWKFHKKKNNTLFFIVKVFFLKQVSFLLLMIVVNLLYFSSIHRFLFTCVFNESNYERLVLSFCFVWFFLNVIVFVYNGLKQNLILQTEPNRFLQISFFSLEPCLCLF